MDNGGSLKPKRERAPRVTDPELAAFERLNRIMVDLDPGVRGRALTFLVSRYGGPTTFPALDKMHAPAQA